MGDRRGVPVAADFRFYCHSSCLSIFGHFSGAKGIAKEIRCRPGRQRVGTGGRVGPPGVNGNDVERPQMPE